LKTDTYKNVPGQEDSGQIASEFHEYIREQARTALRALVEEEVRELCGGYHRRQNGATCRRAGSAPSHVRIGGVRESMSRPRVRSREGDGGSEVALKSWKLAKDPREWEVAMMRAILCGVSTRKVKALRESEVKGESSSQLSRLWQRKAAELVVEVQQSDLSGIDLLVLMLDAVVLSGGLVATVALAIDCEGRKHILGFRVGSSENEEVCRDLLEELSQRGLKAPADRSLLAVLDGSKALKKALLRLYPKAVVQRCLVHKERNIRGYLPWKHWKRLAELFKALRRCEGGDAAKEAAEAIEAFLRDKNAQARESFEEAGEELLALFRLNGPNTLHLSLLSTNCIENVFKNLRRHIGRVCRWREETRQADLWLASGLTLAAKGFRKIQGHQDISKLIRALEAHHRNAKESSESNEV